MKLTYKIYKAIYKEIITLYLDLPNRKRPAVDSFWVLNPPQYTTGSVGGKDAICCQVSKALLLRARGLNSSIFVFTIWNEKPGGSTPFSWNVWASCQGKLYVAAYFILTKQRLIKLSERKTNQTWKWAWKGYCPCCNAWRYRTPRLASWNRRRLWQPKRSTF